MAKKQSSKKRTQVKALPLAEKKLSAGELKKVKGGSGVQVQGAPPKPKPLGFGGGTDDGTDI